MIYSHYIIYHIAISTIPDVLVTYSQSGTATGWHQPDYTGHFWHIIKAMKYTYKSFILIISNII